MAQEPAEVQLLRDALNCGHSLKAGRPAGHVLWLCANEGLLPRSLAFDGKAIGALKGESLARNVRDHWAVENKNHWRRDASQWREDACRLRNPRSAQNFGLLRNALLAIIPRDLGPLAAVFLHYTRNISAALKLLNSQLSAAT